MQGLKSEVSNSLTIMLCHDSYYWLVIMVLLLLQLQLNIGNGHDECNQHGDGPSIRFPFQLVHEGSTNHSTSCPGFLLTCTSNYTTMLELPAVDAPVKLLVRRIDYESQELEVYDPEDCLPNKFLQILNLESVSPFHFKDDESYYEYPLNISYFYCDQNMPSCPVYAAGPSSYTADVVSCTKMFDIVSPISEYQLQKNSLTLGWETPNCTACFDNKHKEIKIHKSIMFAATGTILLVLMLVSLIQFYHHFMIKKEDQKRVEKFLEDYRALKPTRFSYADIKRITDLFKDKLGEGAHGAVFKGKLSNQISVAVKILNNTEGDGTEFINEVGTMGKIHHVNVVRLLGFCADGFHRALVYDLFPNGCLQNFTCAPDSDSFLGWEKLQQIAFGIAKGIEYLHQGCDHRILHFDINPHNVLLDDNLTPKISDFGLAKLVSKNQSTVSMTAARGTLGYIAPEVFSRNFGNVSYKSDIYSYGMLLLEMVGGRKNTSKTQNTFQVLYPEWIHTLIEGGDIHIHIDDEEDLRIAKKLAIVGLWCIQWNPVDRPSMKAVLQMLEGGGDKLKVPPSPFDSTTATSSRQVIPAKRLNLELEVIHETD